MPPKELSKADEEARIMELENQSAYKAEEHTSFIEEERSRRRDRIMRLTAGKNYIYNPVNAATLNSVIRKVAKKNDIEDKVPRSAASAVDFVSSVLNIFQDNGVSEEDLEWITQTFETMKEEGHRGKTKKQ